MPSLSLIDAAALVALLVLLTLGCPPHAPMHPSQIMTAAERAGKLTPQLMAAISATLDTPAAQTMVVAGGNTLMVSGCVVACCCCARMCVKTWMTHGCRQGGAAYRPPLAPPASSTVHCSCTIAPHIFEQEAGKSAGMLTLGVPPSVAQRGGFSAADALFDGCECWRGAGLLGMQWGVICGFLCMQCVFALGVHAGPAGARVCGCLAPEAA